MNLTFATPGFTAWAKSVQGCSAGRQRPHCAGLDLLGVSPNLRIVRSRKSLISTGVGALGHFSSTKTPTPPDSCTKTPTHTSSKNK